MKKQLLFNFIFFFSFYLGHSQFNEGFENTTGPDALPSTNWTLGSGNWSVFDNGVGSNRWGINSVIATPPLVHAGTNAAYMNRDQTGGAGLTSEDYLATPLVTFPMNGKLSFFSRTFTNGNTGTIYQIKVCSGAGSPTNPSNYTLTLAEFTEDQISADFNIYEQKIINLPAALVGTQGYIAFVRKNTQVTASIDGDRWLVDDVSIYQGCQVPSSLATAGVFTNSANLTWANPSGANSWEIEVLPAALSPTGFGVAYNGGLPYSAASTSYGSPLTQTPLTPLTSYKFYVRTICAGNIPSEWIGPFIFATTGPPPVCGGNFVDAGGTTGNYPNNSTAVNGTTVICPTISGEVVTVTFTSFSTQSNADFLSVYDGNSSSAPLLGTFSGSALPPSFTSSAANGCLTFVFVSNATTNALGWIANVTCGPPPTCPTPHNLVANLITYSSANIGWISPGPATTWQVITLPLGSPPPTAATTGWIPAPTNPFLITGLSSGTCYSVYVKSDCSSSSNGLSLWSSVLTFCTLAAPPVCGGNFTDQGGPAGNYPNNSNNVVTICPSVPGDMVTVTFTSFNTEPAFDALYVYDGNSATSTQIISQNSGGNVPGGVPGGYWGSTIPGPFTANNPSGCLTFRFRSDGSGANSGWVANITCGPPPPCPSPSNLTTTVTATTINLDWSSLGSATTWQYLILAPDATNPAVATVGTPAPTHPFLITGLTPGTCYKIYLRSDCTSSSNGLSPWSNGFSFCTPTTPAVCGDVFTDTGGVSDNYPNNSNSTVTICPTVPGGIVTITFTSFDIEPTNDALYVYNGNSTSSLPIYSGNNGGNVPGGVIGGYWGTTIPGPFTSNNASGCLTFRFRSNNSVTNSGWTANVTCGTLDRIILNAFIDANNNGVKDGNEINFTHGAFTYQLNDSGVNNYITPANGTYILSDSNPSNSYDFSYLINSQFAPYYSSTMNYSNISIPPGSGVQYLYFPITVLAPFTDVSITIVSGAPRPGFPYLNKLVYKNNGTTTVSGTITFVKPPVVSISSIVPTGTIANATGFTFDYSNLNPNETRYIHVTMAVPPIPTVNPGTILTSNAFIPIPAAGDINPDNNYCTHSRIVVASIDPNDKSEAHGPQIQYNQFTVNDYLYYTVNFQNEGTADAITVRIEDVLDAQLDETSIRMVDASHLYTMHRINNQITWTFDNINLPPKSVNEELSKGYVLFQVKLKPGFAIDDIIPNTASIYFDTNPAIITNTFNTQFVALNNSDFESADFIISPNPATNNVEIQVQNTSETIESISITDVLGKTIRSVNAISNNQVQIDVSSLSQGIYYVEITTTNHLKQVKKLVIE